MFPLSTATFALFMIQSTYGASRFIIDNDWAFGINTAFPVEQCIQMAPTGLELGGIYETYLFYECNTDGSLTKYAWQASGSIFSTIPLTDEQRSCTGWRSAEQTVITASEGSTTCDLYHFNCVGEDNFAQVRYYGVFDDTTECPSSPNFDMIFTVATDVCQCEEETQTSAIIMCDGDTVSSYSYGTHDCSDVGDFAVQASAADQCTYATTIRDQLVPVSLFNAYHECIVDSHSAGDAFLSASIMTSMSPSSVPSTTSVSSSTADTAPDALSVISSTAATANDDRDINSPLVSTEFDDGDEGDEEYSGRSFLNTDSMINGVENLYVIIAAVLLGVVLGFSAVMVECCFNRRKKSKKTLIPDDIDQDDVDTDLSAKKHVVEV